MTKQFDRRQIEAFINRHQSGLAVLFYFTRLARPGPFREQFKRELQIAKYLLRGTGAETIDEQIILSNRHEDFKTLFRKYKNQIKKHNEETTETEKAAIKEHLKKHKNEHEHAQHEIEKYEKSFKSIIEISNPAIKPPKNLSEFKALLNLAKAESAEQLPHLLMTAGSMLTDGTGAEQRSISEYEKYLISEMKTAWNLWHPAERKHHHVGNVLLPCTVSLEIDYQNSKRQSSRRTIDVRSFVCNNENGYLTAFCHTRRMIRTFNYKNMSNITDTTTGEIINTNDLINFFFSAYNQTQ